MNEDWENTTKFFGRTIGNSNAPVFSWNLLENAKDEFQISPTDISQLLEKLSHTLPMAVYIENSSVLFFRFFFFQIDFDFSIVCAREFDEWNYFIHLSKSQYTSYLRTNSARIPHNFETFQQSCQWNEENSVVSVVQIFYSFKNNTVFRHSTIFLRKRPMCGKLIDFQFLCEKIQNIHKLDIFCNSNIFVKHTFWSKISIFKECFLSKHFFTQKCCSSWTKFLWNWTNL